MQNDDQVNKLIDPKDLEPVAAALGLSYWTFYELLVTLGPTDNKGRFVTSQLLYFLCVHKIGLHELESWSPPELFSNVLKKCDPNGSISKAQLELLYQVASNPLRLLARDSVCPSIYMRRKFTYPQARELIVEPIPGVDQLEGFEWRGVGQAEFLRASIIRKVSKDEGRGPTTTEAEQLRVTATKLGVSVDQFMTLAPADLVSLMSQSSIEKPQEGKIGSQLSDGVKEPASRTDKSTAGGDFEVRIPIWALFAVSLVFLFLIVALAVVVSRH